MQGADCSGLDKMIKGVMTRWRCPDGGACHPENSVNNCLGVLIKLPVSFETQSNKKRHKADNQTF